MVPAVVAFGVGPGVCLAVVGGVAGCVDAC